MGDIFGPTLDFDKLIYVHMRYLNSHYTNCKMHGEELISLIFFMHGEKVFITIF
jgi:hypothetical protein